MALERPSGVRLKRERFHQEAILGTVRYYLRDDERLAILHQGVPEELVYVLEAISDLSEYQQEWVREQVSEEVEISWVRFQEALEVIASPSQEMIWAYERVFTQVRDMVGEGWYAIACANALRRELAWKSEYQSGELQEKNTYQQTGWSRLMRRALKGFGPHTPSREVAEDRAIRTLLKHGPPRPPKLPRELVTRVVDQTPPLSAPAPAPVPAPPVPARDAQDRVVDTKGGEKGIKRRRLLTEEEAIDAHSWRWSPRLGARLAQTPHPHEGYEGDGDDE